MGTFRHATDANGRVTSCCTWCGATSGPAMEVTRVERYWQRRHSCLPKPTRTRPLATSKEKS